jgi:hypothetical protein
LLDVVTGSGADIGADSGATVGCTLSATGTNKFDILPIYNKNKMINIKMAISIL